jgi:hypothetical protein
MGIHTIDSDLPQPNDNDNDKRFSVPGACVIPPGKRAGQ